MSSFDELVDHITNGTVFIESCKEYWAEISAPLIITTISMIFMIIAGFDYIFGNRIGLGQKYAEGWGALPSLALAMVGITAFSPVFRIILQPLLSPVFKFLGSDPSMFAGTILACDMGGYPLAVKLSGDDVAVGLYSGCILASMMGATIVFNIPVGLSIIPKELLIYFSYGTLLGLITVPFGCIIGGFSMRLTPYHLSFVSVLKNMIPVILISTILCLLLFFFPNASMRGFLHFSSFIRFVCVLGAILAAFQQNVIIKFPLLNTMVVPEENDGMNALYSALLAIGQIAIMLTGTLPMVHCIYVFFGKYLAKLGKFAGLDEVGSSAIISCLSSSILSYEMFKDMNPQSIIVNSAFAVGGAFVLGDHLAYIGAMQNDMIVPMIIGKLTQGILAIILAALTSKYLIKKINNGNNIDNFVSNDQANKNLENANSNPINESLLNITDNEFQ